MARTFTVLLPAEFFRGDTDAQLVAGDAASTPAVFVGRLAWTFDDTDEQAIVSGEFTMPDEFLGTGTLTLGVMGFATSDTTNDVVFDAYVEAVTPDADTLNMGTTSSWGAANSVTKSLSGTTAGDLVAMVFTLANDDSAAAGDDIRIGLRADTDAAGYDLVGNFNILNATLYEVTA